MKNILIIGSEGSMGLRYQAILRHLGIAFKCCDDRLNMILGEIDYKSFDGIIISTPTNTHFNILEDLKGTKIPILCEKPITKILLELGYLPGLELDIEIMFQYYEILKDTFLQLGWNIYPCHSSYDYFRTGNDGLYWDCMQIIALHQGPMENLKINNQSPKWTCKINGQTIDFSRMDMAYVEFVQHWMDGRRLGPEFIKNAHKKVIDYKEWCGQSYHRDPGEEYLQ